MFSAFEVIASPQTQESAPSVGRDPLDRQAVVGHRLGGAAAAVGEQDLARLEEVDHRRVRLGEGAEVVAVLQQVLLRLLDLLVGQVHRVLEAQRQRRGADRRERRRLERDLARVRGVEERLVGVDLRRRAPRC